MRFQILLAPLIASISVGTLPANPAPENVEVIAVPAGDRFLRWQGQPGRTYFVQSSDPNYPLEEWDWMPLIEAGGGIEISHEIVTNADKAFFRLWHTDEIPPAGVSLEDWDADFDFISNHDEITIWQTNPLDDDTDGDGLWDDIEVFVSLTDPRSPDSDGDGMPDGWEFSFYLDPLTANGSDDSDEDGLTNLQEYAAGTRPDMQDTDGDLMSDGWEASHGLDPIDPNDGSADSDADGVRNTLEYLLGFDPASPTTGGFDDLTRDRDGDGMPDVWEASSGGRIWDSSLGDYAFVRIVDWEIADAEDDDEGDGLSHGAEYAAGTLPNRWDTDGDGLPDGWEQGNSLDPRDPSGDNGATGDPDSDGLENFDEWLNGTDPHDADSDDDGVGDGVEVDEGADPLDPSDEGFVPPDEIVEVPFTVGDPSGSHSEKWKLTLTGLGPDDQRTFALTSPDYGLPASKVLRLRKWNRYRVEVTHLATEPSYLEDNGNQPDYDWEATVEAKPTEQAFEHDPGFRSGVANFFMISDHWLVDNRQVVFTTEKHGDEENLVSGKTAFLTPVSIRDNEVATGVDDVSLRANDDPGNGHQDQFWIMAPSGGEAFANDTHFDTLLSPPAELWTTCPMALATPQSIDLGSSPDPLMSWRGMASESADNVPTFLLGDAQEDVDLPIHVKTMKKRTVKVACYQVEHPSDGWAAESYDPAQVKWELDRTFGWQINAYFDVLAPVGDPLQIDFDLDDNLWLNASDMAGNMSSEQLHIKGSLNLNPDADIHVVYMGYFIAAPSTPPREPGSEVGSALGVAPINDVFVFISKPWGIQGADNYMHVIAHEIGHLLIGPGHPNQLGGPAPLQGVPSNGRRMHSDSHNHPDWRQLVKTEWDESEIWLKNRPRGDH